MTDRPRWSAWSTGPAPRRPANFDSKVHDRIRLLRSRSAPSCLSFRAVRAPLGRPARRLSPPGRPLYAALRRVYQVHMRPLHHPLCRVHGREPLRHVHPAPLWWGVLPPPRSYPHVTALVDGTLRPVARFVAERTPRRVFGAAALAIHAPRAPPPSPPPETCRPHDHCQQDQVNIELGYSGAATWHAHATGRRGHNDWPILQWLQRRAVAAWRARGCVRIGKVRLNGAPVNAHLEHARL